MNIIYEGNERDRILQARESYSGRLLTDSQFDEAIAITGIIEREIKKTGTFKEKLGDYAHAFARTEKFDALKGEEILRDLYKARTGQSMNQSRESLMEREKKMLGRIPETSTEDGVQDMPLPQISEAEKNRVYQYASDIGKMIEGGNKMSFYRAYAHQASGLAKEFDITEVAARKLMHEEFKLAENQDLYDWGKELEEKYYRPQIEAETRSRTKQQTENARSQSRSRA